MAQRLCWIEVRGFRGFCDSQRIEFQSDLTLIYGPNSQGKTSLAEAFEFLLTGSCIRRDLLGGAKMEFDNALTNVHLAADIPVIVRAKMLGGDGNAHVVARQLTKDYDGDSPVESTLTVDGQEAADLSALGLALGDGAVPAPVLVQHSLRYALCAKPSERAKYFSSLLDIDDLEVFRGQVANLKSRCAPPATATLALAAECAGHQAFSGLSPALEAGPASLDNVESNLAQCLTLALQELGIETELGEAAEIDARAAEVGAALDSRPDSDIPLAALRSADRPRFAQPAPRPANGAPTEDITLAAVAVYDEQRRLVDDEVARLLGVFRAVLATDHLADLDHDVRCPVCTTDGALTPARVETMREQVAATQHLRTAQTAAQQRLSGLSEIAASLARLDGVVPAAAEWDADTRVKHAEAVSALLGSDERYRSLLALLPALEAAATEVRAAAGLAGRLLATAAASVRGEQVADESAATQALGDLVETLAALDSARASYIDAHEELVVPLRTAAEQRSGVKHLRELVQLVANRQTLVTDLREKRARKRVEQKLNKALEAVEKARGKVFDERLEALKLDVKKWWEELRPEDIFAFKDIRRRGTGNRFVTLESELQARVGVAGSGVTRHSLGIASTSQLNALGLAAFLARAVSLGVPYVLLDDPVEAGDAGHRATFVGNVVPALRALGIQVIVATHDEELSRAMTDRFEDDGLEQFSLGITDPVAGVVAVSSSDGAKALLDQAGPWLRLTDVNQRRTCAGKLRTAAERIVKEILVRNRRAAGDAEASLTDYDSSDFTLKPLITAVTPYLDGDNDSLGKLKHARGVLNPGSHEGVAPDASALVQANGDLKMVWGRYLKDDPASVAA
jgi:hypothetical protein